MATLKDLLRRGASAPPPVYERRGRRLLALLQLPFLLAGKAVIALWRGAAWALDKLLRLLGLLWRGLRWMAGALWLGLKAFGRGLRRLGRLNGSALDRLKTLWRNRRWKRWRDLPIRASFVMYTLTAMVIAGLVSFGVIQVCNNVRAEQRQRLEAAFETHVIPENGRYTVVDLGRREMFSIYDSDNILVDEFTVDLSRQDVEYDIEVLDEDIFSELDDEGRYSVRLVGSHTFVVSPRRTSGDRFTSAMTVIVSVLVVPMSFVTALILCATLFFRRKLRRPIAILRQSSDRIAHNDLDFSIAYDSKNEMGQLCESFETMRGALAQNNREMWRGMEERKRLNAAFSHDLRTPLTVLKGHASMLLSGAEEGDLTREEIIAEIRAMTGSITRMERYVEAMASLQRLEDVEIRREEVAFDSLAESLRDSAQILAGDKQLTFETLADSDPTVRVDREIVQQVYENVLANAVRYARGALAVRMWTSGGQLRLRVRDDGPGFSPADLEKATNPFYRGAARNDAHLGLGLNICKILCQRHGGDIHLENASEGGARVTIYFSA